MNNSDAPLGPRPVSPPPAVAHLSGKRAAVLYLLREHSGGVRIADLAARLDLHANTVREHLEALTDAGLAERGRATPSGRGRPAWLYTAAEAGVDSELADPRLRDYAGLAMSLASTLTRVSPDLEHDAVAAGVDWGRELAEADATDGTPEQRLLAVLTQLGFAPERAAGAVSLTQCPLLDAARRYPDVVCRVHLGIVRGAMAVFGGEDPGANALVPFAAPGSCRLELG